MLDPASLPAENRPEWWGVTLLALAGGLAGAAAGWLLARLFTAIAVARRPSHSS
jgi:membrane protein YqaA with SNARE-associated domain